MGDLSWHHYLHHLDLSHNNISTVTGLLSLSSLEHLDLSYNNISTIEGLTRLPLLHLNLSHNNISSLVGAFEGLVRLQKLDLSCNAIVVLQGLEGLGGLKEVDLSCNAIVDVKEVEVMGGSPTLSSLMVENNPLCVGGDYYRLRVLVRLPTLTVLDHQDVSAEEKVKAHNLHGNAHSDLVSRIVNHDHCFPHHPFVNTLPPLYQEDGLMIKVGKVEEGDSGGSNRDVGGGGGEGSKEGGPDSTTDTTALMEIPAVE